MYCDWATEGAETEAGGGGDARRQKVHRWSCCVCASVLLSGSGNPPDRPQ